MQIHSAVVPELVPIGFADLAEAAERLPGTSLEEGGIRLKVGTRAGSGLAGALRFNGSLRTSVLSPAMKVEVVVSPWSAGLSEVAIHPMTSIGSLSSLRAKRFFKAALAILPALIAHLSANAPVEAPTPVELAA